MYRVKIKTYVSAVFPFVCSRSRKKREEKKIEQVLIRILDIINQTINRSRDFIVSIIIFNEIFDITVYNV